MARNSAEQFGGDYDLGSRESAFFLYSSRRRQHINSTSIYEWGITLVLRGSVSCVNFSPIVYLLFDFASFPRGLCFRIYGQIE